MPSHFPVDFCRIQVEDAPRLYVDVRGLTATHTGGIMQKWKCAVVILSVLMGANLGCDPAEESAELNTPQPQLHVGDDTPFNNTTTPGEDHVTNVDPNTNNDTDPGQPTTTDPSGNTEDDVPKDGNGDTGEPGDDPQNTDPHQVDTGLVGDACIDATDCVGQSAVCLDLPGGYCSMEGCDTGGTCPDGSLCYNFADAGTFCLKTCAGNGECREGDGYICDVDNTCWPGATGGNTGGDTGGNTTPGASPVGGPCETDADCADSSAMCYPAFLNGEATGFVNGYCLINGCTTGSCPSGSTCEAIYVDGGTACIGSCAAPSDCRSDEGYTCYQPGICFPGCGQGSTCPSGWGCDPEQYVCIPACTDAECGPDLVCGDSGLCEEPPCTTGSCGTGMVCAANGKCVPDMGDGPGVGPGPSCPSMPEKDCTGSVTFCAEIVPFEPDEGPGYVNYPLNGETWTNQYRSFARRDLRMLIQWATAYVNCKAAGWGGGNGHPLGLGDMSESNGDIPGTSVGQPGHPVGTHVDGYDMDIAYFQNAGNDNYLKAVCDHYANGADQYHCVSEPYLLDLWRTALFVGALQSSTRTRVIGVDGQVGPLLEDAIAVLCANGWIPAGGCQSSMAFETTDGGAGWYHFHHHHLHVSLWQIGASSFINGSGMQCLRQDCMDMSAAIDEMADLKVGGHSMSKALPMPFKEGLARP